MHIAPHKGSRLFHMATGEVDGEVVGVLAHGQHHDGRPSAGLARARASDAFADMRAGVAREVAVEPVALGADDLMPCGWGGQWVASSVIGGEGVYVRAACDDEAHARVKLGTLLRHLHDGDWHPNASARVEAHAATQPAADAA